MTNEGVETLPAKELEHFLSSEIFYEQLNAQETRTGVQASNNFQFSASKRRTVIERDEED